MLQFVLLDLGENLPVGTTSLMRQLTKEQIPFCFFPTNLPLFLCANCGKFLCFFPRCCNFYFQCIFSATWYTNFALYLQYVVLSASAGYDSSCTMLFHTPCIYSSGISLFAFSIAWILSWSFSSFITFAPVGSPGILLLPPDESCGLLCNVSSYSSLSLW